MTTIVLRSDKLVPLTYVEMDQNLTNLNTDKLENITSEPIDDLNNVLISTPQINDVLSFNGSVWINQDRAHASIIKTYCKNNSTVDSLQKGTPVYQVGSQGSSIIVAPADAADPLKMPCVGIVGDTLLPEAEGELLILGEIQGVNTLGFAEGDQIYVAPGGGYTNIKPTDSLHIVQFLGIVIRIHQTSGSGFITGTMSPDLIKFNGGDKFYGWTGTSWEVLPQILDDLSNVTITDATTDQVLKYNGTNWVNANETSEINDSSTTSTNTWSAYKIDGILGDISTALSEIQGV